ncbi:hypothetical protein HBH56_190240 [Parastagonospora nodorum]|uniref:CFEM domain-containing protein n=2 Tax=Phaeosphaeria nodorum (strain SN15 / ATCC MYA-4574 / FGSC 10173) TaxID=321614 RepID=A0A7U2ETA7_PHANO|nr:hypothetical protein SNOG_02506 [Parastagonospora nodorum SN15]KAH3907529.1 hypothetical protein HBH56_190240 [Parastagonospora nodorum]EAT90718.2 hypothetical protein SNOG_02506 [Parastagonospora nodorum SN15]KAH3925137.1 hypothetical protein HBH54_186050 [Parastagonospora nodorum]KAH4131831.1 hypothetical protein HBH45_190030 [Parastagonospora nodorum]KAH4151806.1 hypothetical protein HBH44_168080 [Parastagonospora nodorum]
MKTTYTLLAGLAAQQAAATWDFSGKPFLSPQYANNECSDKQKGGFDWSDLQEGTSNFQYGDFDFSKDWKCSSALGKRDGLTKRTFGNKAIVNRCSKKKPAQFSCDKKKDGFSIKTIDISVEFDVMIDLHYTLVDGSLCKQKSVPCKKEGSTVENTQCGGAKSVEVYLGGSYKGEKSDCGLNFHNIGFECNPPKPYNPPSPPSPPPATSTKVTPPPVQSSSATQSTPAVSAPATTEGCNGGYGQGCPPVQTAPTISSLPPFVNTSMPAVPPPTQESTIVAPPGKESSTVTPVPESSSVVSPPPAQESSPSCDGSYGSDCGASSAPPAPPASSTPIPVVESSSTVLASSTGTPVVESSSAPPAQSSSPSYPPSSNPPPEVDQILPTCMNTWLQISTECKDNTNKDCYCKNAKFTKNVIDCVVARCDTPEQTKKTLQYLVGICAEHVPENPSIVTDCPKDTFDNTPPTPEAPGVPSTPDASTTGSAAAGIPTGPAAAPPANTPAPPAPAPPAGYPVTTITYGSTSLTVPAVHFTTETPAPGATPAAPVGLVPGVAPPSAPAATTPAAGGAPYPTGSTLRPSVLPTGTGGLRPSAPAQFTGAASPLGVEANIAMIGAALAFFAL